jgi:CHAD domain-containing protein
VISIAHYYREKVSDLVKCIHALGENQDEETIHSLRIVYKRIRALHKFIKSELNGFDRFDEPFEILNAIYKNAGTMRENQVNRKLLHIQEKKTGTSFDTIIRFLDNKMTQSDAQLVELIQKADIGSVEEAGQKIVNYVKGMEDKYLKKKGVKYIKKKIRKIKSLFLKGTANSKYHEYRIQIKELFFFLKLVYKKKDLKEMNVRTGQLKNIEVRLGEWHDNDLFLKQLYDFFKAKHITNYTASGSRYKDLILAINHRQDVLIRNMDRRVIKTILELNYFR